MIANAIGRILVIIYCIIIVQKKKLFLKHYLHAISVVTRYLRVVADKPFINLYEPIIITIYIACTRKHNNKKKYCALPQNFSSTVHRT